MKLTCSSCAKPIDTTDAMTCPGCGSLLCSTCAESTGHMCNNCYGGLRFYH